MSCDKVCSLLAIPDGDKQIELTLRRLGSSASTINVNFSTRDGTAQAGADHVAIRRTLSFAPFETEKTITLPLLDDVRSDGDKEFEFVLTEGTSGVSLNAPVTISIIDDEPRLNVNVDARIKSEPVELQLRMGSPYVTLLEWNVEGSYDLAQWQRLTPLGSFPSEGGFGFSQWSDEGSLQPAAARFYRAVAP